MDISFSCAHCGQNFVVDESAAGQGYGCPTCGGHVVVPEPQRQVSNVVPDGVDALTCPVCWLRFTRGDIMHIAVHDSLRGDPVLGAEVQQRFHATRFSNDGQALDALGIPCAELACPHCRRKLPQGFGEIPQHIVSLVGDQSAGKSYYLSVLSKVLPAALTQNFDITMMDADPTGNAPLNDMRKTLFSAKSANEAVLIKTQLEGAMYDRFPRHGRMVPLPKPFVYEVSLPAGRVRKGIAPGPGSGGRFSMVFYDNAGEHFQPGIDIQEKPGAQHVASAAGILFLFDPFHSPDFRNAIQGTHDPQMQKPAGDLQDIILAEMRLRVSVLQNLPRGSRVRTPLAFIVGKSDAWIHLLGGHPGPLVNPVSKGCLDLRQLDENSRRVRALLRDICPTVVANAEAFSERVAYFAASPFGHCPVEVGKGTYCPDPARLAPFQVEVPALWLMSQFAEGAIPLPA